MTRVAPVAAVSDWTVKPAAIQPGPERNADLRRDPIRERAIPSGIDRLDSVEVDVRIGRTARVYEPIARASVRGDESADVRIPGTSRRGCSKHAIGNRPAEEAVVK